MASSPVVGIQNLNLNDAQAILFRTLQQIIRWSDGGDFIMTKANEEKTGFGQDKSQGNLRGEPASTPEGLKRERKGPIDKKEGRRDDSKQTER